MLWSDRTQLSGVLNSAQPSEHFPVTSIRHQKGIPTPERRRRRMISLNTIPSTHDATCLHPAHPRLFRNAGSVRLKCSRLTQNSLFSVSWMIATLLIIWNTFQPVRKCFSRLTSRIIRLTLIGKKCNYQLSCSLRETIHVERHTAKSCLCLNIWM